MDIATFKNLYPEFNEVEDATISRYLEEQKALLNENLLGSKYPILLALLIAHELTIDTLAKDDIPQDVTQIITSRNTSSGSATFLNMSKDMKDQYYSFTRYGVKYLAIKKGSRFAGAVLT